MGMSLSEALAAAPVSRPMRVDVVLSELSKADAVTLRKALDDPKMPSGRIERALGAIGVTCSGTAIANWRRAQGIKAVDAR